MDIWLPQYLGANLRRPTSVLPHGEMAEVCPLKSPSNKEEGQGTELPVNESWKWHRVLAGDLAQPEDPASNSTQPHSQNGGHVRPGTQSLFRTIWVPNQQTSQPRNSQWP